MRSATVRSRSTESPEARQLLASEDERETVLPQGQSSISGERLLLPAIALGTTLAPLNSTMIAVALPEIQGAFGVSITATSWLVTIYLVAMAAGQPIGGRLGDLYGRRRVYLAGLIGFGVASIGCAFAPGLAWLILFRTMQALAGALTFPNGTAMIREAVPQARRGAAFGLIGMSTGIAAGIGPPLGGLFVYAFGWSAIFWANVPVIAVALLLGWQSLPQRRITLSGGTRFDIPGTVFLTCALAMVILIPTMLRSGQPLLATGAGVLGLVTGWVFVRWELRATAPVVEIRLFGSRQFGAACAAVGIGNLVMYTTLLALPLYLDSVLGRGAQYAGFVLIALSALSALFGPLGGRWSDRAGRWYPAVIGGVGMFLGALIVALGVGWRSVTAIVVGLAVMGVGLGVSGAAVQTAAIESVPLERAGSAAGMFSTSRYLGSVMGASLLAAMFAHGSGAGSGGRFVALFAGLSFASVFGLVASSRIAERKPPALTNGGRA